LHGEFFEALHGPGGKPKRTWCMHAKGKGCAVHDQSRPKVCTSFLCDWMQYPEVFPDAWRPDRSGVLLVTRWVETSQGETIPVVQVSEHYMGLIDKNRITDRTNDVCIVNYAHEQQPRIRNVPHVDGAPDPVKRRSRNRIVWITGPVAPSSANVLASSRSSKSGVVSASMMWSQ
jgi:hypothetical protein